jgi:hypothetical protein
MLPAFDAGDFVELILLHTPINLQVRRVQSSWKEGRLFCAFVCSVPSFSWGERPASWATVNIKFTNDEYEDIHFFCEFCDGNARAAVATYAQRYSVTYYVHQRLRGLFTPSTRGIVYGAFTTIKRHWGGPVGQIYHIGHHKSHMNCLGKWSGISREKPATNRLFYDTSPNSS